MPLTRTVAKWFSNYDSAQSGGSRLRAKRLAPLRQMIEEVAKARGAVTIIDVGGTENYWRIVPREYLDEHNVSITIVNLPRATRPPDHDHLRFVEGDGCNLASVGVNSFDIAHSNSVLEHVGDWDRMVHFAGEVSRVAPRYFVQTPNYWFPVEPHFMTPFFHWLPKPMRVWLALHFHLGHWGKAGSVDEAVRIVESARLVTRSMFRELFKDAEIVTERLLGLPKSLIAVKK